MTATHRICLTIDTDPDGLNTRDPDRRTLAWDGLHFAMQRFHEALPDVPLTWYVRADGQLDYAYGSVRYLLDKHAAFWRRALARGDELGWHPHLYTRPQGDEQPRITTDSAQAVEELSRIWQAIKDVDVPLPTFRMGEAWHTPATLNLVEQLDFAVDSSAIPGRDDSASGHPRNWSGAPNRPYYPAKENIRRAGKPRPLLEIPMTGWHFSAPYDPVPRLRYMNPCIHADLWWQALDWWEANLPHHPLHVWTLILHPVEAMPHDAPDMLYAYSLDVMVENLKRLVERIENRGESASYVTVSAAAERWRAQQT